MLDLKEYGFHQRYEIEVDQKNYMDNEMLVKNEKQEKEYIYGRVSQVQKNVFKVITSYGEVMARIKGSFYNGIQYADEFPAVGDFVQLQYVENGDSLIIAVCERMSKFSRPDYSGHGVGYVKNVLEQVVAANFDYVFIMASLNKDFNVNRILRYITVAWESGGIPVVILTKADLIDDYEELLGQLREQAIGVDIIPISALKNQGLELLEPFVRPGKTIVFLGSSGVGKSTLVNALAGEEIMKVNEIREDDSKGKHTTTYRHLIRLSNGAIVIDTPGMRELGIWDVGEGIGATFSDIEDLFDQCKFSDCSHNKEPGCAINKALEDGSLDQQRWDNYLRIKQESKFSQDKSAYLREKRAWAKGVAMYSKSMNKSGKKDKKLSQ